MFTTYALIKNGAVVEYPVNPRVWNISTESYNISEYWMGGELDGKMYAFVHNNPPKTYPFKNAVENNVPVLNPDNQLWYRGYNVVDASLEEIAQRTAWEIDSVQERRNSYLTEAQEALSKITNLPPEGQQEWDAYFADLQNIESQSSFPWDLTWPTRPDQVQRVKIEVERI